MRLVWCVCVYAFTRGTDCTQRRLPPPPSPYSSPWIMVSKNLQLQSSLKLIKCSYVADTNEVTVMSSRSVPELNAYHTHDQAPRRCVEVGDYGASALEPQQQRLSAYHHHNPFPSLYVDPPVQESLFDSSECGHAKIEAAPLGGVQEADTASSDVLDARTMLYGMDTQNTGPIQ